MVLPAVRNATYRDLVEAPEHLVAELIGGDLYLQPRPAKPHAEAASVLAMLVGTPFRLGRGGPGGWTVQFEPELHLPSGEVLVPDLAGRRRSETPRIDTSGAAYTRMPQWVAEVVSPATAGRDRVKKLPRYAGAGVEHAWLVDPLAHTLEVFRRVEARWSLVSAHEGDEAVRAEPFDAVALDVSELWVTAPEPSP